MCNYAVIMCKLCYVHRKITAQKMKFSIKNFFPADLVTFTEEILNGNFIFCAVNNEGMRVLTRVQLAITLMY